ncbi:uncharacterized protein LOC136081492 [Hydra vulgaris]|uniref:Uncharacterized protein LOC136081492 n=1 Tax=Hydra vulgaris TaxID=6087 RepID=A0ABM4C034_HYDVU
MRTYKKKTERGLYPKAVGIEVANYVVDGKEISIRASAKKYGIHYLTLFHRNHFSAPNIYNVDETGIITVQKPNKIIARKVNKQVGALTSQEQGTLVTMVLAVNACGNSVPPMLLFPRKKVFDHFIRDGPNECIGASKWSGWMNEECFVTYLNHFIRHVKPTKESPVILLLDNHQSHLPVQLITLCKDNSIVSLSFPPHCSHKLQPLDRSVFGQFKKCVASAQDSWMK